MSRKQAFRVGRARTGLGLFATEPIKRRGFIVDYKGRKLTTEQADILEARGNRYLYEINSRWTIDGTTLTNIDAMHWQVNYNGGASLELITFHNGAGIDPDDFVFV